MTGNPARKWWALVAIAASVLVVGLDLTVLNLALPTIATDLHASSSDLQWISDAYSLVLAAAMLPAGLLGDRLGRKKVLLVALILFGAASVACAYAAGTGELIAARAALGVGAAAIFPLSLSVIPVLFAPEERQKAIALMASATFISFPIGPIVGGYLLDHFWWGSVFLINVPVVVLAVIAVAVLLPESRSAERPRIDAVGVILSSAGLAALTFGFIKAGQDGWSDSIAVGTIAAGVAVLAILVAWERWLTGRDRAGNGGSLRGGVIRPLIELRLFRSAGFTWGTTLSTLVSFAMFGMIGSTRLASPRQAADGTASAPRASVKGLVTVGFAIMAVTLGVGATSTLSSGTGFAAAWFAVFGLGLGLAMPQTMNAALSALSAETSGAGSALISAMRQVGATIGVAVLGTVLSSVYRSHLVVTGLPDSVAAAAKSSVVAGVAIAHAAGSAPLLDSVRQAFVAGMDALLWVCGGIALASAILALIFLPRRAEGGTAGAGVADDVVDANGAERAELEA